MQLIDEFNVYKKNIYADKLVIDWWISVAYELLETEKQQILQARMQDMDSGLDPHTYIDVANEYYSETYKQD